MTNKAHDHFRKLTKDERVDLITGVIFSQMASPHDEETALGHGIFKLIRPFMGRKFEITLTVTEHKGE